jgi:hypothetical protein
MGLLERLREVVRDEREIEMVITSIAHGGTRNSPKGGIEYYTAEGKLYARLRFRRGRITGLEPGPALNTSAKNELMRRVSTETSHDHGTMVVSSVLFAERPLNGTFMWDDAVRISPCPEGTSIGQGLNWLQQVPGLPNRGYLGPPFPLILEVRVWRSPNGLIESNRALRELNRYQFLLTLFLAYNIRFAHWDTDRHWALITRDGRTENHLVQPGFSAKIDGQTSDFPVLAAGAAPICTEGDYYDRLWFRDDEMLLPASLESDLQLLADLSDRDAARFVRACYWFALATQFYSETSLSQVAYTTAIECLLPRESDKACAACGKKAGPGPTQLFKRHVEKYGTVSSALERSRSTLYDVRSDLVHGSHASPIDLDFLSVSSSLDDRRFLMHLVARRSLIGWLRDPLRATLPLPKEIGRSALPNWLTSVAGKICFWQKHRQN